LGLIFAYAVAALIYCQGIIAQTFVLNSNVAASNFYFVMGAFSTSTDNITNPVNYGSLSFNMELTNSIGPGTTSANVIAGAIFFSAHLICPAI
jgi:hypothetical protein